MKIDVDRRDIETLLILSGALLTLIGFSMFLADERLQLVNISRLPGRLWRDVESAIKAAK